MVGLFGYLAAGVAQNVGAGMVEQAKALREQRMEELREQRLALREQTDRDFRAGESQKDRDFRAQQGEADRAARRESAGQYTTAADGSMLRIQGDRATPVTGADNQPIKTSRTHDRAPPAEVATAEWLIEKGVAESPAAAWEKVRQARANPDSRARMIIDVFNSLKRDNFEGRPTAELRTEAESMVDNLLGSSGGSAPAASQGASSPASPAPRSTPVEGGSLGAQVGARGTPMAQQSGAGNIPAAPIAKTEREIGKVYRAPDGRKVEWTGQGWKVVE